MIKNKPYNKQVHSEIAKEMLEKTGDVIWISPHPNRAQRRGRA